MKEKLEIFLSKSNNLIKISERINKGIQNLKKEQKNIFKNLSYITKINTTQKEMNTLFQELMRNIKIDFNDENKLKFEEYYFNGIPKPNNIEFKDIAFNSLQLSWKIDDLNILNLDNKKIKFVVEMSRKNKNFIKIYEGNDRNCKIDNLKLDSIYKFRICSIYNNILGDWIETQDKTIKFICNSIILQESNRQKEFIQKLMEWTDNSKMELIYRGTRDGTSSDNFHSKCDNQGPTLTLCKHENGYIF